MYLLLIPLYGAGTWDLISDIERPFTNHYLRRKNHVLKQKSPADQQWNLNAEVYQWYNSTTTKNTTLEH